MEIRIVTQYTSPERRIKAFYRSITIKKLDRISVIRDTLLIVTLQPFPGLSGILPMAFGLFTVFIPSGCRGDLRPDSD